MLNNIGFSIIQFSVKNNDLIQINVNDTAAGNIFIYNNVNTYNIKTKTFIGVINLDIISNLMSKQILKYSKPSQFPAIFRDISILIDKKYKNIDLINTIYIKGGSFIINVELFDCYSDDSLGENNQSLAYSLTFRSNKKTLQDKDINKNIDDIVDALKSKYKAIQR